jgi:hypothetical protein
LVQGLAQATKLARSQVRHAPYPVRGQALEPPAAGYWRKSQREQYRWLVESAPIGGLMPRSTRTTVDTRKDFTVIPTGGHRPSSGWVRPPRCAARESGNGNRAAAPTNSRAANKRSVSACAPLCDRPSRRVVGGCRPKPRRQATRLREKASESISSQPLRRERDPGDLRCRSHIVASLYVMG